MNFNPNLTYFLFSPFIRQNYINSVEMYKGESKLNQMTIL